jgi:hypothetical protein
MGCRNDDFKSNAIEIGKIMQRARELIEISSVKNVTVKDRVEKVVITHDTTKSKQYFIKKNEEINSCYRRIKYHFNESDTRYIDSLYILALTNKIKYLIIGHSNEDICIYLKLIQKEKGKMPSVWVLDDVFGPILSEKGKVKEWNKINISSKYEMVLNFLFMAGEGEKCME